MATIDLIHLFRGFRLLMQAIQQLLYLDHRLIVGAVRLL